MQIREGVDELLSKRRTSNHQFKVATPTGIREVRSDPRKLFELKGRIRHLASENSAKVGANTFLIEPLISPNRWGVFAHRNPPTYAADAAAPMSGIATSMHSRVAGVV